MQNPQDDILLQLFQQQSSQVQPTEKEAPESFTEVTPKDNARVEGFLDALFKNANTLAVASSTCTVGSIMAGSFAVARIIAIPAYVCTIGYSVAVMTSVIAAFEQFSGAVSEKGFSIELNPDFWKSVSRATTRGKSSKAVTSRHTTAVIIIITEFQENFQLLALSNSKPQPYKTGKRRCSV
ncbi:hypothetical protein [Dulcicalothrix desertica]|uniref:hypothetical protein n=1 Tax=Dulcicalothrix desertica TaxID=32056 RepID=UPI00119B1A26|nr:hypothetical protein [Dulcicalothrix desertica]TWH61445.1 hypothetical protein CAL7102_01012 [Dulcicalothrix desertica PCC 7102]